MGNKYDFSGYATKNDLLCGDGRTIRKNAFKDQDGQKVPLVWGHQHGDVEHVLGHALLENREDGVYAYGFFNDTEQGKAAKKLVMHGDVNALSIYANKLKQIGGDVVHGCIRELSLVLAGANPGAYIDFVLSHSDDGTEELEASWNENIVLYHSDELEVDENMGDTNNEEVIEHAAAPAEEAPKAEAPASSEKTIGDVIATMNDEQKEAMYALIGQALADQQNGNEEGDEDMKHNAFDSEGANTAVLSHDAMDTILKDGKRCGSLKESFLAHAADYGIEDLEILFPDAKTTSATPDFISREMGWVPVVMNGTHHSPFSRVKTQFADITEDQARAKGYIKGKLKKEEVFSLLKRTTQPTTIYKKQKLDRDDIIDIVDFDVLAWVKQEMRIMLDEEIARAILIGDGRLASDDDKIDENCIRPIVNDADLFVIRWAVKSGDDFLKDFIKAAVKSRKNYKGSGNPIMFTTEDILTDLLLMEDSIGHKLYKTEAELATALRVSKIVTVPVMENFEDKDSKDVFAVIVNLSDYTVGADKGGSINMFDDFDIDYNQQKYLMETRCSGALVKPFSAIVIREGSTTGSEEPTIEQATAPYKPSKQANG